MRSGDVEVAVTIPVGKLRLQGDLAVPRGAGGLVLFAHGSGSSRKSPRNRFVAEALRHRGVGTLLLDLLTEAEESADEVDAHLRFDIALLSERLVAVTDWARAYALRIGYFGASTGAAAALCAAAERPTTIAAVVSRGGRPDLAGDSLRRVLAPTLLIVGGADTTVLELNRGALRTIAAPEKELVIVPGATHLFEEPGTLDEVARLAGSWFARHVGESPARVAAE